jgi:hypothetical protein
VGVVTDEDIDRAMAILESVLTAHAGRAGAGVTN